VRRVVRANLLTARPPHSQEETSMTRCPTPLKPLAIAASLALLALASAHAQTTPAEPAATPAPAPSAPATAAAPAPAAAASTDGLQLDRVVVTGTSQARSKMRSSVSVSTVDGDSIVTSTAASATEVLRSVPGIRSESSGGESNANVGVRGIPISAGGARYIQFQEDGLPVLQFGDIAFATPDTWIRADVNLDRLEVVRGGSASTLATGGPGGIINFISKNGREQGGSISLSQGLDYQQTRVDVGYGGRIAPKTRFYIGGFQRVGDGGRPGADGTEKGGQIRANLTQEFDGGFVRVSFKHLDDNTPTFLPTPVRFVNGEIKTIPGLDPRRTAFYDVAWPKDNTLTASNGRELSDISKGLKAKSSSFGVEFELDVGSGVKLSNKFRIAKNTGRFMGIFPGDDVAPAPAGTTIATGPGAGSAYTGDKFTAIIFNTKLDDLGLAANDFKASKRFDLGGSDNVTVTGGLYASSQKVKLTWNFNQYSLSAQEEGARVLNVPGTVNGSPGFGGCCMNTQDSKYKTLAPYLILAYEAGPLSADVSVRQDRNSASGTYNQTIFTPQADPLDPLDTRALSGVRYDLANSRRIDYDFNKTSFSLGGNYRITNDVAVFARYSDGAAYNADRITFFNNANLVNGNSPTIPQNKVKQWEGGVKWREGGLSVFGTLFLAKTDEVNVDLTSTPIAVNNNKFKSKGLELEAAYRLGDFRISGGATYTNAEQADGRTPKRQAKLVYQLTPEYSFGNLALGASIVGTTAAKDDGPGPNGSLSITLPAFATVNAFASYQFTDAISLQLAANNLFDKIGYTESNDGRGAARSINGRTVKATLKYAF
jgi:catecholate siderophore receptor